MSADLLCSGEGQLSHFEYISVALALLNALTVGFLLSSLPPVMDHGKRYWVHVAWVFTIVLVATLQWWSFWTWRHVAWSPIRFLWALSVPGLLFVQATLLVGETTSVTSFRDHFFERRIPFFSVGIALAVSVALSPWVLGLAAWLSLTPSHPVSASIIALYIAGIGFRTHLAHAIIVSLAMLLAIASFFWIPVGVPAA
jgi:hypothetical protein